MEFTPGVIAVPRRRGFLTGDTPDHIAAAVFEMLAEAVDAGISRKACGRRDFRNRKKRQWQNCQNRPEIALFWA